MNARYLILGLLLALIAAPAVHTSVLAQEACFDSTGASIPCPPSEDGGEDEEQQKRPTVTPLPPTPTATSVPPTATALPLADQPEDGVTEAKWTGSCSGAFNAWKKCLNALLNSCYEAGGDVDILEDDGQTTTISCTIPEGAAFEPDPLPLGAPEDNSIGTCNAADGDLQECIQEHQRQCTDGLLVVKVDIYEGIYEFFCVPHTPDPQRPLPFAIPPSDGVTDDNWAGVCEHGAGFEACLLDFHNTCDADGGTLEEYDTGLGSTVAHCIIPTDAPPFGREPVTDFVAPEDDGTKGNWTGGCFGTNVDQCVSDLAAACAEDGGDLSVWYDDEGGAGVHCENESEASGDSWEEECSWASCWMADLSCWMEGGSGYGVEDSVGNTGYHCDLPSTEGAASPGNLPPLGLAAGLLVVLAAVAIPAVMKNARRGRSSTTNARPTPDTNDDVLLDKSDGGTDGPVHGGYDVKANKKM